MKVLLRWKKNPHPTGLAGICSGNPGHSLNANGQRYASAYEHSTLHTGKRGWWWCASGQGIGYYNSCNDEPLTEEEAKEAAMKHVKDCLAQQPTGKGQSDER